MAINIAEKVQERLAFPPLQKVDPNTESAREGMQELRYPVTQCSLIAALAALYKITRTKEGGVTLLMAGKNAAWLNEVYGDNFTRITEHIATYAGSTPEEAEKLIRQSADTAVLILHEELADHINVDSFMEFMSGQRDNILLYMPVGLQIGEMLHDKGMDDNTHKMEGPVSTLMHKIENIFSENK